MAQQERLTPRGTVGFLRRLGPRVRPYWASLLFAGVLMLFSVSIGLAFPLIVRELLDAAFLAGDSTLLNRIAIGLLSLFAALAVVNFFQSYLTAAVSEKVVADLRRDLFGALIYQPPGFFANRRVGELSSRLASDSGLIQGVLRFGVPEIIRQVVFLVGALGVGDDHEPAAHAGDADGHSVRRLGGVVLRTQGETSEHAYSGSPGRCGFEGGAGVHADPHGPELHA